MKFNEKLKKAMQELHLNQRQVCGMTGKSKGSVSQYLSGKQVPSQDAQSDIAVSLGLAPDYFTKEDALTAISKDVLEDGKITRMLPADAAKLMGVGKNTIMDGLRQGVFPWGYAIKTSNKWTYWINAKRFAEIEGVII